MQVLTDNEYGFDVGTDNPFLIFRILQHYAKESVGEGNFIDLSRGDPGYGFTPSVAGRESYSFLVMLDTHFNNDTERFIHRDESYEQTLEQIQNIARNTYSSNKAEQLLASLDHLIAELTKITQRSKEDVLFQIFKYATVSGGTYHDPKGEEMVREVVAHQESEMLGIKIEAKDIIPTNGANHAIGTFFELMGSEGLNYLEPGDTVAICSPVYAPYNLQIEQRGLKTITFNVDPLTGELDSDSIQAMQDSKDRIKLILIIDPNNPTGFPLKENQLKVLAEVADQHDSIILTDEVYFNFFNEKESILKYAPNRTVRISALTKIERSAGIRFGYYMLTDEANDYLSKQVLHKHLKEEDLRKSLIFAKAPGGTTGSFQHVTFVPGPMQYLGLCHMILGNKELQEYKQNVAQNMQAFTEGLNLDHDGNAYYIIFDLNSVEGGTKKDVPVEQKMIDLAKAGVVFIPAFIFFDEKVRQANKDKYLNMVRASVVNTSTENVAKAAQITKQYLTS
jgi:aspartate/methionine/tyrosine aminotransferase